MTYQTENATTKNELFLGTEKAQIINVQLNSTFDYHKLKFISQRDANLGPFIANPVFNFQTGNFYFLSKRSLTEVPTFSCDVYSSCGACFRAEEKCIWTKDEKCKSYKTIDQTLSERIKQCFPKVYAYEPKGGLVKGDTVVSFYGTNFGVNRFENKHSFEVAIGGKACRLLTHNNTYFTCLIEDDEDNQERNSITTANESKL